MGVGEGKEGGGCGGCGKGRRVWEEVEGRGGGVGWGTRRWVGKGGRGLLAFLAAAPANKCCKRCLLLEFMVLPGSLTPLVLTTHFAEADVADKLLPLTLLLLVLTNCSS